jgi:hypothetical protein
MPDHQEQRATILAMHNRSQSMKRKLALVGGLRE